MWFVQKPGVSLYDENNDSEEAVSVSINVLSQDISSYDSLFLEMLWMGMVFGMVVSIFFKRFLFGWTNVGLLCIHVAFDCGFRNWSIFGHLVYSQFRPILNKTIFNCFAPGWKFWRKKVAMVKIKDFPPPLFCQKTPLGTKSSKTHGLFWPKLNF